MTTYLLIVTILVSVVAFSNPKLMGALIFNPYYINRKGQWYRFTTSAFIHADWLHLAVNMFVLYSFGPFVEEAYKQVHGEKSGYYYLLLYLFSAGIAVLPSYLKNKNNPAYNALGASGATSAVVFAAIIFNPWQKLLIFGIIPLPGIAFGIGYLVYSYYMGRRDGDNINHDAHFWGAVFGFAYTLLLKPLLILYFVAQLLHPHL